MTISAIPAPQKPNPPIHNHFLRIAYDGTAYRGWQRQPDDLPTVQQTVEDLLSRVHHREVTVGGCGRTDAGVHASQYYLHLRTERELPDNYRFFVNKQLPGDIRLLEIIPVDDKAQARYDATERTYDYFFHAHPDAFLDRFSSRLDLTDFAPAVSAQMLPALLRHQEYRAFCKTPDRHNTTLVHFTEASLFRSSTGDRFRFRFRANRFLRGMIRLLVQDLIRLGTNGLSAENFHKMLESGERAPHFQLAPPEGLFLSGVAYPYLNRPPDLPVTGQITWHPVH
ncbi:MAG: tRNA pseudouridine(38-40) synthase TruA [Bacteroidota bacterium]